MSKKVYMYLWDQLKTVTDQKNNLENENHEIKLCIDSTKNKIESIRTSSDNTEFPFYTTQELPGFENNELKQLKEKVVEYQLQMKQNQEELDRYVEKEKELNSLLDEALDDSSINTRFDIVKANELERQRIARDIHDTVVQNITALIYKNDFMKQIIDADSQRVKLELDENSKVLRSCIEELRSIIYDLRPMSINDLNFKESFSNIISHLQGNTDMIIEYKIENVSCNDSITLISVIRIIQELCNDSIKYSKGQKISINITQKSDIIFIDYKDDGVGFDDNHISNQDAIKSNSGFGMSIIKDRVLLLHGTLTNHSKKNQGVNFIIKIPVSKENNQCQ